MSDRLRTGLFANLLPQPHRRASIPATGTIWLGEAAPTAKAFEAPLSQHEHDAVSTQWDIPLASQTGVMHFGTDALTMGTTGSLIGPHDLDFNAPIGLHLLTQDTQFC